MHDGSGHHRHLGILLAGIVLALACLLVLVVAAASAATKRVEDGKRETSALAQNGRVDIIAVSNRRFRGDLLYRITMRKRIAPRAGKERPFLLINIRGDGKSDPEYLVIDGSIVDVRRNRNRIVGDARLTSAGRNWSYRFDPDEIPGLDRYGWAAATRAGKARDIAPNDRYAKAQV